MDGQRLGTPSYMPPEQARGEDLDVRADVYAIGAMMYELLTGRSPYRASDEKVEGYVVLERVKAGPPPRIEQLSKGVPAELVAIVDRAMARDRDQRYATVLELATDLRAFLSQRTVKAYRTGALVEMKMWMRRNRALARTLVIAVLLQTAGIIGTLVLYTWTEHHRTEASHARTELGGKVEEFDRLAQVLAFDRLVAEEPTLVPGWPDQLPAIQRWRADTASLLGKRDALGRTVAALQRQQATAGGAELATGTGFLAQALAGLLEKLPQLAALDAAMAQREAWAAMLGSAPAAHGGALFTWTAAREAIAKADGDMASTLYAGQRIELRDEDVHGLVPLGRDPTSKLWEFYDLRSAWDGASELARIAIPRRQADGSFLNSPDLGAILVLMPGGPLPDPTSTPDGPDPRRNVRLDPFFVGKYEVTRGQWLRWGGAIPPGPGAADPSARPVAQVSWKSATQLLRQHGLILPSELQWEYAARGGTSSTWWNGDDWNLARRVENLGSGRLLPVGSGQANPFGLFDVAGNVRELCSDEHTAYGTERPGDGRRPEPADSVARSCRGGSFAYEPDRGGSGHRNSYSAAYSHIDLGLRVVRPLRRGR